MVDGAAAVPNAPSVAAVIVNYRTPLLTIACVESLLRSTGTRPRIIIVDNDSRDDSIARISARLPDWPGASLLSRSKNDGYTGGNNIGIAEARRLGAQYVLVLNSDTIVAEGCIEHLLEPLERDSNVVLAAPRIFFGDAPALLWFGGGRFSFWTGRPVHVGLRQPREAGWQDSRDMAFASGCAFLLRLDALPAELPVFEPSLFAYAEDLDLSLRIRASGRRIRYVPAAEILHFEGSSHRGAGGQPLRFYFTTRNTIRVVARHARWFHWPVLAPMLAVNVVGRYCVVSLRDGDLRSFFAVLRGARDAMVGGRHPIERYAEETQGKHEALH